MVLAELIEQKVDDILEDWSEFARHLGVAPEKLSDQQRRNSAREILLRIAHDMRTGQSADEQIAKSKGEGPEHAPEIVDVARTHADDRLAHGFTLEELVSEYRALRATVIRHWQAQPYCVNEATIDQMVRFNEAIDQALTESIAKYSASANRLRDLFNGILAHDLRSPLGAIHNSAQYLLRDEALGASSTKAAAAVLRSADRMKQMVNDLLDFSRIRLGDMLPMTPTTDDLRRISHQAVEEVCASYPSFQVEERYDGIMVGTWDGARLGQLLTNLLVNAAQHGTGSAVLVARCEENEVVVAVSNGGEIPADKIDKIFDPLIRSASTARKGTAAGVGLGLYIAKAIVKTHGGTIEVRCSDGSTTLAIKLPRHCMLG